jgi:hypothetical protein
MTDIQNLPAQVGEGQTGHLHSHQIIHAALKDHEARVSYAQAVAGNAEAKADNAVARAEGIEALAELSPESPVDGQTANLIAQSDTLTRSALDTSYASKSDLADRITRDEALANYASKGDVEGAPLLVYHGDDHTVARPDTPRPVMWVGTPHPLHSIVGDLHMRVDSPGSEWSPAWLDVLGWYDMADVAGSHGDAVSMIPDRSGKGYDLVSISGEVTITDEGLPHKAVYFDGASYATSLPLVEDEWARLPVSVYVVGHVQGAPDYPAMTIFDSGNTSSENGTRAYLWLSGGANRVSIGQGVNQIGTLAAPDANSIIHGVFTGTDQTRSYLNGELSSGPGDAGSQTPVSYRLGANAVRGNPYIGTISEVLIVRNVTQEQDEKIMAYLSTKHGIVI